MFKVVATTAGAELLALRLGSNIPALGWMAIGSGSGTAAVGNKALVAETDRNAFSSLDYSTARKMLMTADFSSVEMSGTNLREFGAGNFAGAATGSLWNREGFPSISFDGSNELQIQLTYEVYVE